MVIFEIDIIRGYPAVSCLVVGIVQVVGTVAGKFKGSRGVTLPVNNKGSNLISIRKTVLGCLCCVVLGDFAGDENGCAITSPNILKFACCTTRNSCQKSGKSKMLGIVLKYVKSFHICN